MEYVYNLWDICMLWVICNFIIFEVVSNYDNGNDMSAESTIVRVYLDTILMDIIYIFMGQAPYRKKIYDAMNPPLEP